MFTTTLASPRATLGSQVAALQHEIVRSNEQHLQEVAALQSKLVDLERLAAMELRDALRDRDAQWEQTVAGLEREVRLLRSEKRHVTPALLAQNAYEAMLRSGDGRLSSQEVTRSSGKADSYVIHPFYGPVLQSSHAANSASVPRVPVIHRAESNVSSDEIRRLLETLNRMRAGPPSAQLCANEALRSYARNVVMMDAASQAPDVPNEAAASSAELKAAMAGLFSRRKDIEDLLRTHVTLHEKHGELSQKDREVIEAMKQGAPPPLPVSGTNFATSKRRLSHRGVPQGVPAFQPKKPMSVRDAPKVFSTRAQGR